MKNQHFDDTRNLFKYDLAHELMLGTGLRRLARVLSTAEPNASTSESRKARKPASKHGLFREIEGIREEFGSRAKRFPTLMAIGVAAMLGFASVGIGLRLDLGIVMLTTLAGTIIVVWLVDEILRRGNRT